MTITRRPTPPGPITELFDRINELYRQAGEPSPRRIAAGIGRGVISYSTVYSALSGPRVPSWGFLKLIVMELEGDPAEFQPLWLAAWEAGRPASAIGQTRGDRVSLVREPTVWDSSMPPRHRDFVGRLPKLRRLRESFRSGDVDGSAAQVLHGHGGAGKTELAVEFAYLHRQDYDVVWFIGSETEHGIRESLIELGRRLQLHDLRDGHSDHLVETTLRALRHGVPYERSLIIFDNALSPEIVLEYVPRGHVHVMITTQSPGWNHLENLNVLEVVEFTQVEAAEYLSRRVPWLSVDAGETLELTTLLSGLPLAVEQTAAYLNETELSVVGYLDRFQRRVEEILDPDSYFYYPRAYVICVLLTQEALSEGAAALLDLLAMISPERVSGELLVQSGTIKRLPDVLHGALADSHRYRRAAQELARFSLARFDGVRDEIQLHRVVYMVVGWLLLRYDPARAERWRRAAQILLAGADPGTPEREETWPLYDLSYPHLFYSGAVTSAHAPTRALVTNQVRRLYLQGRVSEAYRLSRPALLHWRKELGEDGLETLELATEHSAVLRLLGKGADALELTRGTLRRLDERFGAMNRSTLICARNYSTNLRFLGRYAEAQSRDQRLLESYIGTFGESDFHTLNLLNNIAIGLRCMGRYEEALEYDRRTHQGRAHVFGQTHRHTLDSQFAVARDLRRLGRYEDSLGELRRIRRIVEERGGPLSLPYLLYDLDLSVALRRVGSYPAALHYGEMVLQDHHKLVGQRHEQTLTAATDLITNRWIAGEIEGALELGEQTVRDWTEVLGAEHPNTLAAEADMAVALRLSGDVGRARETNTRVLAGLTSALGRAHPHCLVVMCNLASDMAASGMLDEACQHGEHALDLSRHIRGEVHPFTLATAANLALDLDASGDETSRVLYERTLNHYRAQLPPKHPEIRAVEDGIRVNLDVEPDHT